MPSPVSCESQGAHRRRGRDRDRRARAPQSRPYIRPCARSGDRLFEPPPPWRGGGDRHGAGLPLLGATRPLRPGHSRRGSRRICARRALPSIARRYPGDLPDAAAAPRHHAPGQEGAWPASSPSSWCAASARPSSPAMCRMRRSWLSSRRNSPGDDRHHEHREIFRPAVPRKRGGRAARTGQDGLRGAIDLHHKDGAVVKQDRDMLGGILDLSELEVSDVMVHRTKMTMVDAATKQDEIIEGSAEERPQPRCRSGRTGPTTSSASCM